MNYDETKKIMKQDFTPKRSVLEEIGNAITHGVGALFSILALILMLYKSQSKEQTISAIIYFTGLIFSFLSSTLYHSFKHGTKVKRLFRRFDYLSIYLLIGATFAPILLVFIGGSLGSIYFFIQWLIIITGVTFVSVFGAHRLRWLHFTLYFVLGWSGIILIPTMLKTSVLLFLLILGGGIIYTLGIIPFTLKKSVAHFIWHFFVLFGAVVQWFGIYLVIF